MILFYATEDNSVVQTLERQLVPYGVIRCLSISAMEKRLRKPGHGLQVALILIHSSKEMDQIQAIRHLVRDLKVILVLPGHDQALIAGAHMLGPRFIAYSDNGHELVGPVLQKMLLPGKRTETWPRKQQTGRE